MWNLEIDQQLVADIVVSTHFQNLFAGINFFLKRPNTHQKMPPNVANIWHSNVDLSMKKFEAK